MVSWPIERASAPAIIEGGSTLSLKNSTCGGVSSTPPKLRPGTAALTLIGGGLRAEPIAGALRLALSLRLAQGIAIVSSVATPNCLNAP